MDQEIFLPGNDQIGIWSCPYLDLVLDGTRTDLLPEAVPRRSHARRTRGC